MDIAKYIGLYLLKNKFCYIHGLGNLKLERKAALMEGDNLQAPQYTVVLGPGGSIDDSLANYIATHEQVSIAKTSNSLREFSTDTRNILAQGGEVAIPGIGKFVAMRDGTIGFQTDEHLSYTPPAIPALQFARRVSEPIRFGDDTSDSGPRTEVQWGKILLYVVLIAALAAGAYFAWQYMQNKDNDTVVVEEAPVQQPILPTPMPVIDSPTPAADSTGNRPISATASGYKVILYTYNTREAADARIKRLENLGKHAELAVPDSSTFYVLLPVAGNIADSARAVDSLRVFFGLQKGSVRVY